MGVIMKTRIHNGKILITLVLLIITAVSCTFSSGNNDQDIQELKNQIDALSTQNAKLLEQNHSSELSAPPPPVSNTDPQVTLSSPTTNELPKSPVSAGTPIIYQKWSMTVSNELVMFSNYNSWGIKIYLRNLGGTNRVFRFKNSGVTASDNLGNIYKMDTKISIAGMGNENCETIFQKVKNLEVKNDKLIEISSGGANYTHCTRTDGIHMFEGPIPLEVS